MTLVLIECLKVDHGLIRIAKPCVNKIAVDKTGAASDDEGQSRFFKQLIIFLSLSADEAVVSFIFQFTYVFKEIKYL